MASTNAVQQKLLVIGHNHSKQFIPFRIKNQCTPQYSIVDIGNKDFFNADEHVKIKKLCSGTRSSSVYAITAENKSVYELAYQQKSKLESKPKLLPFFQDKNLQVKDIVCGESSSLFWCTNGEIYGFGKYVIAVGFLQFV